MADEFADIPVWHTGLVEQCRGSKILMIRMVGFLGWLLMPMVALAQVYPSPKFQASTFNDALTTRVNLGSSK